MRGTVASIYRHPVKGLTPEQLVVGAAGGRRVFSA